MINHHNIAVIYYTFFLHIDQALARPCAVCVTPLLGEARANERKVKARDRIYYMSPDISNRMAIGPLRSVASA